MGAQLAVEPGYPIPAALALARAVPTLEIARQFRRAPQALANRVYANRLGNGDEASGDG